MKQGSRKINKREEFHESLPAVKVDERRRGLCNAVLPGIIVRAQPLVLPSVVLAVKKLCPDLGEVVAAVVLKTCELLHVDDAEVSGVALAPAVLLRDVGKLQAGSETRVAVALFVGLL